MWMMLSAGALAADLQLSFITEDGLAETASWPTYETYTRRMEPRKVGKSTVTYVVSVPSSVFDTTQGAFIVDVSVCLEWTWKSEKGQYCDPIQVLAKTQTEPAKFTRTVKDHDKFTYTLEVFWTGEPPEGYTPPPPAAPSE